MAEITAALVKQLREKTGAGMMECKKALEEANGDLAQAEVVLRKRGIASAGKKASRAYVHKHSPGTPVTVYYNPAKPGEAILEPGPSGGMIRSSSHPRALRVLRAVERGGAVRSRTLSLCETRGREQAAAVDESP